MLSDHEHSSTEFEINIYARHLCATKIERHSCFALLRRTLPLPPERGQSVPALIEEHPGEYRAGRQTTRPEQFRRELYAVTPAMSIEFATIFESACSSTFFFLLFL